MDDFPNRQTIRLKGYDYSQNGLYFVTICIQHMGRMMGDVGVDPCVDPNNHAGAHVGAPLQQQTMILNDVGKMMERWWCKIPDKFHGVELDVSQIMPNHLHGIINIVGVDPCVDPSPVTLGTIIQWFKTMTTNEYLRHVKTDHWVPFPKHVWQRNFYERIIRNEQEYFKICNYIKNNPQSPFSS